MASGRGSVILYCTNAGPKTPKSPLQDPEANVPAEYTRPMPLGPLCLSSFSIHILVQPILPDYYTHYDKEFMF